ncbi:MAG TPA: tetratricopeptide repeat protein [Gemmatimonadales bacterium]|jgi:tetratricopeptide (TPR) repeat protein|nr:tetratricopeptide repeat protein [Gemmatimonadales bacterium]
MSSEPRFAPLPRPTPERTPRDALQLGRAHDLAGRLDEAAASYQDAVGLAESCGERPILVEALRRLGVVHHRRSADGLARDLCGRSYKVAVELGKVVMAGEALNALAGFEYESGQLAAARNNYVNALSLAGSSPALLGRIEQNLGILDSVQGDHDCAFAHYRRALDAFQQTDDEAGCAIAYHNLGLIECRRGELDAAELSFERSVAIATRLGDVYLQGLCELHRAEVSHARRHYADAMLRAEAALRSFERLGDRRAESDAYKIIGKVLRDTGRLALAEERLRTAMTLAVETGWLLGQADASRELARLHQGNGKKLEALSLLKDAHGLYGQLEARLDLKDIDQRIAELAA